MLPHFVDLSGYVLVSSQSDEILDIKQGFCNEKKCLDMPVIG